MQSTMGTFAQRLQTRLADIDAERTELAELECSWAEGMAGHLAELLFSLDEGHLGVLDLPFPLVTAGPTTRCGAGRFLYANTGGLRARFEGGWAYERVVLDERGAIRIVTCAPGRQDPDGWETVRAWRSERTDEPFSAAEVFESLRQLMSRIVARVDELGREIDERRASLDELPDLVHDFRAACGPLGAQADSAARARASDAPEG